jgi:lipopolysaccharide transport system permease protein
LQTDHQGGRARVSRFNFAASRHTMTVIDQSGISFGQKIAEYRQYFTLFLFLTLRDITLRYRQTLLGVVWAVLQPVLPMVVFPVVFARVLRPETGSVPYSLFAMSGLVPWTFFANAMNTSGSTFATNHNLLNKVYFPRAILPGAAVAACVVDLIAGATFLLGMLLWQGYRPAVEWLWLPVIALAMGALALAVGLAMAVLIALYRDIKHVFPVLVQLWMFATPVMYPAKLLSARFRWALDLNPMAGVVEACRSCLFGTPVDWNLLMISGLSTILISGVAALLFHHLESDLAERA